MKAKAQRRGKAKTDRSDRKASRAARPNGGRWRMSDLPPELQVELRHRLEEARRGENLIPFEEAVEEAERMAAEIVEILNRYDGRRAPQ